MLLNKTTEEYEYRESTNIILGEKVYSIRRIGKLDIVFEQVANSYPETINSDSYLFSFLSKIGIDKSLLLEILKKNSHKFSIQELEKITQLDLMPKHKFR